MGPGTEDPNGSCSAEGDLRAQARSRLQGGGGSAPGGRVGTAGKRPGSWALPRRDGRSGEPTKLAGPHAGRFLLSSERRKKRGGVWGAGGGGLLLTAMGPTVSPSVIC